MDSLDDRRVWCAFQRRSKYCWFVLFVHAVLLRLSSSVTLSTSSCLNILERNVVAEAATTKDQAQCTPPTAAQRVALYHQMPHLDMDVASRSQDAQLLFKQGLLFAWDFNQEEAQRSFQAATELDPSCAMCYWGIAYARGPMINRVFAAEGSDFPYYGVKDHKAARLASGLAQKLAQEAWASDEEGSASPLQAKEVHYCDALASRFSNINLTDATELEALQRYAARMTDIGRQWQDVVALALAAEALMVAHSWDYYDAHGQMYPAAEKAQKLILEGMDLSRQIGDNSSLPLLLHLHIHIAEADQPSRAARAETSADSLAEAYDRLGHLLHMPGHLYLRVGRYADCVSVSKSSISTDMCATRSCLQPYAPKHNLDMMIYCASMGGHLSTAQKYAHILRHADQVYTTEEDAGGDWTAQHMVWVPHGLWSAIHDSCPPSFSPDDDDAAWQQVVWLYVRFMTDAAHAAPHMTSQAVDNQLLDGLHRQLEAIKAAAVKVPYDDITKPGPGLGMYCEASRNMSAILVLVAQSRVAALHDRFTEAAAHLGEAVVLDDSLGYAEPPRMLQPLRQCLAWLYLKAGDFDRSQETYLRDLEDKPHNGWSLLGLHQLYSAHGMPNKAADAYRQYKASWSGQDPDIPSSCPSFTSVTHRSASLS